jgi:hypothetical protein
MPSLSMIGGMRKIVRTCYWLAGAVAAAALAARSIKAVGVDERYAVLPMVWREAPGPQGSAAHGARTWRSISFGQQLFEPPLREPRTRGKCDAAPIACHLAAGALAAGRTAQQLPRGYAQHLVATADPD